MSDRGASTGRHRGTARVAGGPGLAMRQFRADPWVSVFLAVLVLVVTLVATVWPRLVLDMNSRQLPYVVNNLSHVQRDVSAGTRMVIPTLYFGQATPTTTVEESWGEVVAGLERVRNAQPEPLRSLLQPGHFHGDLGQPLEMRPGHGSDLAVMVVTARIDPMLPDFVELVDGDWPEVVVNYSSDGRFVSGGAGPGGTTPGGTDLEELEVPDFEQIQVLMLDEAAEELHWPVGESRGTYLLTGTYRPLDPDHPRWAHAVNSISMGETFDGNVGRIAHTVGYLAPGSAGNIQPLNNNLDLRLYYPLDASGARGDQVDLITAQLLRMASTTEVLEAQDPGDIFARSVAVTFSSESTATFRELSAQQRATASILAVVAAGPVGVTLAVFTLGARLIVSRRRSALALAIARGGSPGQVRGLLALEGLLLGLPAAAAGYWLAGLVLPGSSGWSELLVAAVAGLVPAATLGLAGAEGSLREQRHDIGARSGSRVRWIVEAAVLALAALAVWRLLDRGLTGVTVEDATAGAAAGGPAAVVQVETGVDLLMAATPILLALAACVLTLRLYPLPVHLLTSVLRRRRGLTGFLGAARSLRDPAGGLVPALAVILGVAVAVSSAVMASTITHGAETAAWRETGAEIRMSGPTFTPELRERLAAVDGVAVVATAREATRTATLTGGIEHRGVGVIVIDDEMQQVAASAGPLPGLPDALFDVGSPSPVLTGGLLTEDGGTARLGGHGEIQVLGHLEELPGVRTPREYVVMSAGNWQAGGGRLAGGPVALVSLTGTVPADQVTGAVAEAVPNALLTTPHTALEQFREAPVSSGLTQAFMIAVLLTTALTVLAILLVQLMGAPARARLLAVLRTLGLAPRQGRALTAWELGPLLASALAVGAAVGVLLPWLLLRAIDLTGMTGGSVQPALHLDWGLLALVVAGILLTVTIAVTVSATIASRTDLAQQLRVGEER